MAALYLKYSTERSRQKNQVLSVKADAFRALYGGHHQTDISPITSSFTMARSNDQNTILCMNAIMTLTAVKVRTLCDVAVRCENQLYILNDTLKHRGGKEKNDKHREATLKEY